MKKKLGFAIGILFVCGAWAQAEPPAAHPHWAEVGEFCAAHAQDCAELRSLRTAAHQACADDPSKVAQCQQARQQFRAELKTLENEGFPAPHHGSGAGHAPPGGAVPAAN